MVLDSYCVNLSNLYFFDLLKDYIFFINEVNFVDLLLVWYIFLSCYFVSEEFNFIICIFLYYYVMLLYVFIEYILFDIYLLDIYFIGIVIGIGILSWIS